MPIELPREHAAVLEESISELTEEVRTINALEAKGILTIGQILECCYGSQAACNNRCFCREGKLAVGDNQAAKFRPRLYLADLDGFGKKTIDGLVAAVRDKLLPPVDEKEEGGF